MTTPGQANILNHIFAMPGWHKMVLTISMILAGGGTLGSAVDYFTPSPAVQSATSQPTTAEVEAAAAEKSWLTHRVSPWAMRIGFAFLGGLVIGFVFRLFLKIMTLLTLAVTTIFVGLNYFNVLNLDLASAEAKYKTGMEWVTTQAEGAAKKLAGHLPDGGSSFLGMFMGFKRKKVG